MTYNDPSPWIDKLDSLLPEVEDKIKEVKKAIEAEIKGGKAFLPPNSLLFNVLGNESNSEYKLRGWTDLKDKIRFELSDSSMMLLRKGHYNDDWHHNPNGEEIPPPNHIHFPTCLRPNLHEQHTFAYPVKSNIDYLSALKNYCMETNVEIQGTNISLVNRLGR